MTFVEFINEKTRDTNRLYYNYLGISRKSYSKWAGWKIINLYKEDKSQIKDIDDPILNLLVENFYRLKYIEEYTTKS